MPSAMLEPRYRVILRTENDHGIQYVTIEIRHAQGLIGHPIRLEDMTLTLAVAIRRANEEILQIDGSFDWDRDVALTIKRGR
jgi:hypothetical protein